MVENVENPVAAGNVIVEGGDKAGARPACPHAPGLAQNDIIHRGADDIMRRPCPFGADACGSEIAFVAGDSLNAGAAKLVGIRLGIAEAQEMREVEKGGGRLHERRHIAAAEMKTGEQLIDRHGGSASLGSPGRLVGLDNVFQDRRHVASVLVASAAFFGDFDHRRQILPGGGLFLAHSRNAHISISSPGNSPARCRAIAPDVSSCFQSGDCVSISK
ncbi:hypothetical protein D3C86_1303380 [compost metagenome]